jgi:hypothetical protein
VRTEQQCCEAAGVPEPHQVSKIGLPFGKAFFIFRLEEAVEQAARIELSINPPLWNVCVWAKLASEQRVDAQGAIERASHLDRQRKVSSSHFETRSCTKKAIAEHKETMRLIQMSKDILGRL